MFTLFAIKKGRRYNHKKHFPYTTSGHSYVTVHLQEGEIIALFSFRVGTWGVVLIHEKKKEMMKWRWEEQWRKRTTSASLETQGRRVRWQRNKKGEEEDDGKMGREGGGGLEPEHPLVCLSDGRQTPWGKTRPGCSEESSWASPWGRFAAAASRCPESRTPSCCRTGLRDAGTQTQRHTFSTVRHIKKKMFSEMGRKERDRKKFSVKAAVI